MKSVYILSRPNMDDVYSMSIERLFPLIKSYSESYISQCTIRRKVMLDD